MPTSSVDTTGQSVSGPTKGPVPSIEQPTGDIIAQTEQTLTPMPPQHSAGHPNQPTITGKVSSIPPAMRTNSPFPPRRVDATAIKEDKPQTSADPSRHDLPAQTTIDPAQYKKPAPINVEALKQPVQRPDPPNVLHDTPPTPQQGASYQEDPEKGSRSSVPVKGSVKQPQHPLAKADTHYEEPSNESSPLDSSKVPLPTTHPKGYQSYWAYDNPLGSGGVRPGKFLATGTQHLQETTWGSKLPLGGRDTGEMIAPTKSHHIYTHARSRSLDPPRPPVWYPPPPPDRPSATVPHGVAPPPQLPLVQKQMPQMEHAPKTLGAKSVLGLPIVKDPPQRKGKGNTRMQESSGGGHSVRMQTKPRTPSEVCGSLEMPSQSLDERRILTALTPGSSQRGYPPLRKNKGTFSAPNTTPKSGSIHPPKHIKSRMSGVESMMDKQQEDTQPPPPSDLCRRITKFHRYAETDRQKSLEALRVNPKGLKTTLGKWIKAAAEAGLTSCKYN